MATTPLASQGDTRVVENKNDDDGARDFAFANIMTRWKLSREILEANQLTPRDVVTHPCEFLGVSDQYSSANSDSSRRSKGRDGHRGQHGHSE